MEKKKYRYSTKNIPIPTERSYKLQLMEKIEMVIRRMRWKAIMHNTQNEKDDEKERYGLKTLKCPKQVREMIAFENELIAIVKNVKFRKFQSDFQNNLQEDIKVLRNPTKTMTFADKTSNMYRLTKEEHDKLVTNAVTTTYKKVNKSIKEKINKEGKRILKDKDVINRLEINSESDCFITLKDHKENFENNPKVRLINPAKNEIGRISKVILDNINVKLKEVLNINQWKNTKNVIDWFANIQDKHLHKFIIFDIKDFYPSIKESLLKNALNFAEEYINITNEDKIIINHARKSLLFKEKETWMKKDSGLFDVTMGAFDGAEVCELVGSFILHKLSQHYEQNNIGLYRDDGLAVFKNVSGPESEKIKKQFTKIFKENGLEITIQCNMKIVNYLDVTLNLENSTYRPYQKENNEITYIHKESNHPPSIIKQLPIFLESRLSTLSSNENIFKESIPLYQEALQKSGYKHKFKYQRKDHENTTRKRQRKQNIIWFNPPYSKNVTTKVGRYFLSLLDKHFPPHSKLHKIFNRNTVKVSYSCMPNLKSIINTHNKAILHPKSTNEARTCNCTNKQECPLNQNCLVNNILYKASLTSNNPTYKETVYFGLSETAFKVRFSNHKKSFNIVNYKNDTELSKEVWRIKESGDTPVITWEVVRRCLPYNLQSKRCSLCLNEKLEIAAYKGNNLLNKKNEVVSKCRHKNKYALCKYDTKD